METITGTAAGVPFTALPPERGDGPAPLIVTWHMLDAPRSDAAFAAALPMAGVPAWRVHLGMPLCGARLPDAGLAAHVERARDDIVLSYVVPIVEQAVDEFPAALASLRDQLPLDDGPIGVLGGSLGGAVALRVLTTGQAPVGAVALVNPGLRVRTVAGVLEGALGEPYVWSAESERVADDHDSVARAAEATVAPPLLLVSGEQDIPASRVDAAELVDALRARYERPDDVETVDVPDLAHALADEPGLEPAPQRPTAKAVDDVVTGWFRRRLPAR